MDSRVPLLLTNPVIWKLTSPPIFTRKSALKIMVIQQSLTVLTGFVTTKKLCSTITMTANT